MQLPKLLLWLVVTLECSLPAVAQHIKGVVAEFPTPLTEKTVPEFPETKVKGKVKSMEIKRKALIEKNSPLQHKLQLLHSIFYPDNSYYIISYREDGTVSKIETFDSLNKLWQQELFEYDNQNRIVGKSTTKSNVTKKKITYTYDSLNRWSETIRYDSAEKPYVVQVRKYKDNTVTVVDKNDSGQGKTVYTYEPGKMVIETFLSSGMLYFKSEEKTKGVTSKLASAFYNQKGEQYMITSVKDNGKKASWNTIVSPTRNVRIKGKSLKNKYGDFVEVSSFRAGYSEGTNGDLKENREYIYDERGNFVSRIDYYDGKAAYQLNRHIEYYD